MSPDGLVITAGGITFAGNFADAKGFPPNGIQIIGATVALAIIFSFAGNTPLEKPVKALAGLMVLAAVYTSVPAFTKKRKKKSNG